MDAASRGTSHLPRGHENWTKAGKGFFKVNNESIAEVREDLVADYQALVDRHSEEVVPPVNSKRTRGTSKLMDDKQSKQWNYRTTPWRPHLTHKESR